MTLETHNRSSPAHQELHKIVKDENFPIVNQVDARVQNFEIQFLKEAAKFVGDFKSLAKEADGSLAKQKALELEIERLLRAGVSQDIMSVVQKESVVDTSNLQTELERLDNTKTRRPQPRRNTKNDRVPFASKSSRSKNKGVKVAEHHRNLLLSKNMKHMSSACNNIKLESQNVISKVVCAMCKQCLISVNHDVCLRNYVTGKTSRVKKHKANVSIKEKQKKHQPTGKKPKKVGFIERLATPKPSKPRFLLRWSPTGRLFDQKGKIVNSNESESQSDCSNGDNALERRNRTLVEAARTMLIFSRALLFLWAEAIATACFTQNHSIIHRRFNKTPYELINGRKPDISFLHVFGALCYPKNDRKDIGKLGAKGDIGFFIGYSADSRAYRIYNRRTKKIMETMNVLFDELSAMAFEQRSSKPGLQSELELLFEAMYDDYIGGQPSATARTVSTIQEPQVRQTSMASTSIADTTPTPPNSSSQATNIPITSQDVEELNLNAMVDGNTFVNPFANPYTSTAESSSSQNVDPSNMHMFYQPYPHEFQ
nr:retrovirus-related Pol polyprotein from transposon TNT 1-94 [Tanacetum cinerariifolium]